MDNYIGGFIAAVGFACANYAGVKLRVTSDLSQTRIVLYKIIVWAGSIVDAGYFFFLSMSYGAGALVSLGVAALVVYTSYFITVRRSLNY